MSIGTFRAIFTLDLLRKKAKKMGFYRTPSTTVNQ